MKMTGSFRKPLGRMINEGLRIKHTREDEFKTVENRTTGLPERESSDEASLY